MKNSPVFIFAFVTFLLLLLSCSSPEIDVPKLYDGERLYLQVKFNSTASSSIGGVADDKISTVRLIVFTDDGEMVSNEVKSIAVSSPADIKLSTLAARGRNDFYVICNETPDMAAKLDGILTVSQIEQIRFEAVGLIPPLPMYKAILNTTVTANTDGTNVRVQVAGGSPAEMLTVDVVRLVAKLNVTVIKNIPVASSDQFEVLSMSYRVAQMPKYSTIKENTISDVDKWASDIRQDGIGSLTNNGAYNRVSDDTYVVPDGVDKITFPDINIPEHILAVKEDITTCTYLIITAKCRLTSGIVVDAIYKLNLGMKPPMNMDLLRNNQYNIYATITGLGALGFHAEIVPLNMVDLPVTWSEYRGLAIVSELEADYGLNKNIDLDYSQYFGILKYNAGTSGIKEIVFKYGSTVAVAAENTTTTTFTPATDILWKPVTYTSTISTWGDIALHSSGDILENKPTDIGNGVGDPCRLVGLVDDDIKNGIVDNKQWRMATPTEYQHLINAKNDKGSANGFLSFHYMIEPNTGFRDENGVLSPKGSNGYYWSSIGHNSFSFTSANGAEQSDVIIKEGVPEKAYTIRCVRVTPPVSVMSPTVGVRVTYLGTTESLLSANQINVPYWTTKYVSGASESEVAWIGYEGFFNKSPKFSVKPLTPDIYYKDRTFNYEMTGYGLDGVIHKKSFFILQEKMTHTVSFVNTINPGLIMKYGYLRMPKIGGVYTITPEVYPVLTADQLSKIELRFVFGSVNSDGSITDIVSSKRGPANGTFTIEIPPNNTGSLYNVGFKVEVFNTDITIRYEANNIMQEK